MPTLHIVLDARCSTDAVFKAWILALTEISGKLESLVVVRDLGYTVVLHPSDAGEKRKIKGFFTKAQRLPKENCPRTVWLDYPTTLDTSTLPPKKRRHVETLISQKRKDILELRRQGEHAAIPVSNLEAEWPLSPIGHDPQVLALAYTCSVVDTSRSQAVELWCIGAARKVLAEDMHKIGCPVDVVSAKDDVEFLSKIRDKHCDVGKISVTIKGWSPATSISFASASGFTNQSVKMRFMRHIDPRTVSARELIGTPCVFYTNDVQFKEWHGMVAYASFCPFQLRPITHDTYCFIFELREVVEPDFAYTFQLSMRGVISGNQLSLTADDHTCLDSTSTFPKGVYEQIPLYAGPPLSICDLHRVFDADLKQHHNLFRSLPERGRDNILNLHAQGPLSRHIALLPATGHQENALFRNMQYPTDAYQKPVAKPKKRGRADCRSIPAKVEELQGLSLLHAQAAARMSNTHSADTHTALRQPGEDAHQDTFGCVEQTRLNAQGTVANSAPSAECARRTLLSDKPTIESTPIEVDGRSAAAPRRETGMSLSGRIAIALSKESDMVDATISHPSGSETLNTHTPYGAQNPEASLEGPAPAQSADGVVSIRGVSEATPSAQTVSRSQMWKPIHTAAALSAQGRGVVATGARSARNASTANKRPHERPGLSELLPLMASLVDRPSDAVVKQPTIVLPEPQGFRQGIARRFSLLNKGHAQIDSERANVDRAVCPTSALGQSASVPYTMEQSASIPDTMEQSASVPDTMEQSASVPDTMERSASNDADCNNGGSLLSSVMQRTEPLICVAEEDNGAI